MEFLNIVTEEKPSGQPWILRRAAEEIHDAFPETTINEYARSFNYFINYALYKPTPGVLIGHYTHLEEGGEWRKVFLETIPKFQYYTVTCEITRDILISEGAHPDRIFKIKYGCDGRLRQRGMPIFGVVGRTYPSGRKGEELVQKMVEFGYEVHAWGRGWPVKDYNIHENWDWLPKFYDKIDYLVVTSVNEGGPVPVVDAIAAGVPVIAPNVGWCWEFPVIHYERGSWESLHSVIEKLCCPPSWQQWSAEHGQAMMRIKKENA